MENETSARSYPLEGIKILDFTWSVAGPTMTRYLGGLGARIFKVEWPKGPDPMRNAMFRNDTDQKTWNNGAFFGNLNVGKESLTINVKDEKGLDLIKELVGKVDAVTESFSSGVMERWGLDFDTMREINPQIVYVSVSGFGHTGPHASKNTWGPTAQAMSGMTAAVGVPGRDPAGWGYSYLDVCAGYMGAIAVTAGIRQARSTGRGMHVDLSQVETGLALVGPMLTEYLTHGERPPASYPGGNRSLNDDGVDVGYRGDTAPISDIFPTAGDSTNDWVALTVDSPESWASLQTIIPQLDRFSDLEFSELYTRRAEISQTIGEFTKSADKYELADEFASRGIPAAPVQGGGDRLEKDPQFEHRSLLQKTAHPQLGELRVQALPYRSLGSLRGWDFRSQYPILGADTLSILKTVLSLTDEQLEKLEEDGIFWPEGVPKELPIAKSLW